MRRIRRLRSIMRPLSFVTGTAITFVNCAALVHCRRTVGNARCPERKRPFRPAKGPAEWSPEAKELRRRERRPLGARGVLRAK